MPKLSYKNLKFWALHNNFEKIRFRRVLAKTLLYLPSKAENHHELEDHPLTTFTTIVTSRKLIHAIHQSRF